MTDAVARRAGSLKHKFARRGLTLTLADMIVAATALEHGAVLLTDNLKDLPIAELRPFNLMNESDTQQVHQIP